MGRLAADLAAALDPARFLRACGLTPEAWQQEVLRLRPRQALLNCCRQAGKSLTAAAAAVHEAVFQPGSLILMFAPTQRQAMELLKTARQVLIAAQLGVELKSDSAQALELSNGSRIVSLPAREDTIRGYSHVALLIFDEAGWVPDELYLAARPMLAVSGGRILALSTPNGQSGWFHREWAHGGPQWHRTKIPASLCPRIPADWLAQERERMTIDRFASEYECEFTDAIDSVFHYANITAALDPNLEPLYQGGW
jgi:hypothetical protein